MTCEAPQQQGLEPRHPGWKPTQQTLFPRCRGHASRHGAHGTHQLRATDPLHPSLPGQPRPRPRPRPQPPSLVRRSPPIKPSWLGGARARGLLLPLSTLGSVVPVQVPVGRQSPASRRNLEKSQQSCHPRPHYHLYTCPVTSHSRSIPARRASVRARPEEERETFSSLQRAVLEEAGSTARPPLPPPPSPPDGYRAGARGEAAAPAAAAGGAAAAGAAGDAPARLLRRGTVRAAAAGELAGGSGCGGCSRGAESWRRRRS